MDLEHGFNTFGVQSIYPMKSLADVPAKLLQAFKTIRTFLVEEEQKQIKKAQAEAEAKMKATKSRP